MNIMSATRRLTLSSAPAKHGDLGAVDAPWPTTSAPEEWPQLPTETELYILPDGQVVIADLPVELQSLLTHLGRPVPAEIEPSPGHD